MTPTDAKILAGETVMFRVTIHNATESGVTWTLSGTEYSGETCGMIGSDGLYTAGDFGTKGQADPLNIPGARCSARYLNDLWLFERKNYASSQPK